MTNPPKMPVNEAIKLAIQCLRDKSAALEFQYSRRSLATQQDLERAEETLLTLKEKPELRPGCLTLPLPEVAE